ncbi:MAG TPA: hypothetical protein VKB53_03540 [Gammaproteobacteria bacterium]|nr:hypothetical protein [Gammaproteobacteria bacterium]
MFDLSGPVESGLFPLRDPERVVIDMDNAQFAQSMQDVDLGLSVVEGIRHARQHHRQLAHCSSLLT